MWEPGPTPLTEAVCLHAKVTVSPPARDDKESIFSHISSENWDGADVAANILCSELSSHPVPICCGRDPFWSSGLGATD